MLEQFREINFHDKTLRVIQQANVIIREMEAQGYTLTLRQLYYQFVARDWLQNTPQNYDRLGVIVDNARKAGLIDWDAIEDRTRFLRRIPDYTDVPNFLTKSIPKYAEDIWRNQDTYCEVWLEKDALLGVVSRPCNERRVPYVACRGQASSSLLYESARRLQDKADEGKGVFVFYVGDHDPSGIFMPRSAGEWLDVYSYESGDVNLVRIALNMDQIEALKPPPNAAKEADSRYISYVSEFSTKMCWELDALPPKFLDDLVRDEIDKLIDWPQWDIDIAQETERRRELEMFRDEYNTIKQRMA